MTYKKKLIEVALPLAAISDAASKEKTLKNSHPANLHLWWARRPLAAARAVVWASLVDDPSSDVDRFPDELSQSRERDRLFGIVERLVQWDATSDESVLDEARAEINRCCGEDLPTILDPFGGGGAIPLEASRLHLPTATGDLNPVAVLIQRAMLELPARFWDRPPVHPEAHRLLRVGQGLQGLAQDVVAYGMWMRDQAKARNADLYPNESIDGESCTPIAWIWARTVPSPDPSWSGHVPLVRSWVLGKRPGKPVTWVEPMVDSERQTISFRIREGGEPPPGTVSGGAAICIATGAPMPGTYLRSEASAGRMRRQLIAVALEGRGGRRYVAGTPEREMAATAVGPAPKPNGSLPPAGQGLGFRVQRYGFTEWSDLFTDRQLAMMGCLSGLLAEVHEQILAHSTSVWLGDEDQRRARDGGRGATAYADAVVTYLAFAIDKLADLNNALARWEPIAQCPRHLFGRQTISMTWDYAEANPFSSSSGSFETVLQGIRRTLEGKGLHRFPAASVEQRDARHRLAEFPGSVISTDPPYYDNVGYADLSDFFYVWLRANLADVWPDEVVTLATPKSDELIADSSRAGSKRAALQHFESGMTEFFRVLKANSSDRFPSTVYYAFKATEGDDGDRVSTGWETFLSAMVNSGLIITATWPIRTENKSRLRALNSNALASSIVLACRVRPSNARLATRGEFVSALRSQLGPAVRVLQEQNIAPVDLAQSAIGPGISVFSNYVRVVEADGEQMTVRTALGLVNEVLAEVLSGEESEFDADTRFALTWFEQYGHTSGPFGDADLLARAKDTTVAGVAQAGIVKSRDGKVELIGRWALSDSWDPAADARLTVWETTQYLIRALESSEAEAAALLARLGEGLGDRARQLAYLLFGICDRKRWAEEATAYNMLVTAWPELSRLAAAGPAAEATGSLF